MSRARNILLAVVMPFLLLGCILGMAVGCSLTAPPTTISPATISDAPPKADDAALVTATRALIAAEYGYYAAGKTALALTEAGVIHGPTAARLLTISRAARTAIALGHAAQDAATRLSQARALEQLTADVLAITRDARP